MKRILFFAGLFWFFFTACTRQTIQPNLTEDQMARIMGDLVIADAAAGNFSGYQKDSLSQVYYQQVFDMHHTSLEEYEKNLRLYADDLDKMERISKQVEDRFKIDRKQ